jgi:RNA polymerase sigma-70 factor (ECF subfamily)
VVRLLLASLGNKEGTLTGEPTTVNGDPALLLRVDGEIDSVMAIRVEDGLVTGIYFVRNPAKLTHIAAATPLTLN